MIKRGDLIEFDDGTDPTFSDVGNPDNEVGLALADERDGLVPYLGTDGRPACVRVNRVVAYAWQGWCPDELVAALDEVNR